MKYTTVLIDFDDTLIDTQGYAAECLSGIYKDYNINNYFSSFESFSKLYFEEIHRLWDAYALGKIDKKTLLKDRFYKPFEAFADASTAYLDKMNEDFMYRVIHIDKPIEGAEELLKYLKARYKIVMLSNGFSEMQYNKMQSVGFSSYFDEIILSDVVGVNKPHPDIFEYALDKSESAAEQTIMIGDNLLADIGGAKSSNIDQIWFNPTGKTADFTPTFAVKKLTEIRNIL